MTQQMCENPGHAVGFTRWGLTAMVTEYFDGKRKRI